MRKQIKNIGIHRETLLRLTSPRLGEAAGAVQPTIGLACSNSCVDTTCAVDCTFRCPSRVVVCP